VAELVEVTDFGRNPTRLRMHLYVPATIASDQAILLGLATRPPP
jgi:hypothetical protein